MDVPITAASSEDRRIICCCGPKTWTRVVGWMELISCALVALGTIIWYMAAVAEGDRGQDQDQEQDHDSRNQQSDTKAGIEITIENALGKGVGDSIALVAALTFWILIALASLTILLLLVGNEKERAGFFIPWLILSWIGAVLTVIGIGGLIFSGKLDRALGSLPRIALSGFCLYVVHQRYNEIKENISSRAETGRAEVYEKVYEDA